MKQNTSHRRPALLALTFVTLGTCAVLAQEPEIPTAVTDIETSDPFRKDAANPGADPARRPSVEMLDAEARALFARGETKEAVTLQAQAVAKTQEAAHQAVGTLERYAGMVDPGANLLHYYLTEGDDETINAAKGDGRWASRGKMRGDWTKFARSFVIVTPNRNYHAGDIPKLFEACRALGVTHLSLRLRPPAGNLPLREEPAKSEPLRKDAAEPAANPARNPFEDPLEAQAWTLFARGEEDAAKELQDHAAVKAQEAFYKAIENLDRYRGDDIQSNSRLYIFHDRNTISNASDNIVSAFGSNAGWTVSKKTELIGLGRTFVILTLSKDYPFGNIAEVFEACRAAGVSEIILRALPSAMNTPVSNQPETCEPEQRAGDPDPFADQSRQTGAILLAADAPAKDQIIRKLENIIIPVVDFEDTSLGEALDFLRLRAVELDLVDLDPRSRGVNFVVAGEGEGKGPSDAAVDGETLPLPKNSWVETRKIGSLHLRNVSLGAVLKYIALATGTRFEIDDQAVIFFGPEPIQHDMGIYNEFTKLPETEDRVITYVMKLDFISPADAERIFKPIVSQGPGDSSVVSVPDAASVMIMGTVPLIRKLVDLKTQIDRPGDQPMRTKFFTVTHADTADLAMKLNQLIAPEQAAAGKGKPMRILGDPRTKRIMVMGRPIDILFVMGLIAELDVPAED